MTLVKYVAKGKIVGPWCIATIARLPEDSICRKLLASDYPFVRSSVRSSVRPIVPPSVRPRASDRPSVRPSIRPLDRSTVRPIDRQSVRLRVRSSDSPSDRIR